MPKIKVKPKARRVRAGRMKLDSLKTKLNTSLHIASPTRAAKNKIDSLEKEVVKLKIEVKKK